ncbi:MAG: serine hydroxymethyltransferase [Acholeplasmataceae bacterium]|jgi:glycine hydroxymethyltransferase|nr:serine hydroxymethyltransferase [Acholeplasmataceae bacterium]MCK9234354.1 serine hydroxymethyltransferase [Acholeplasmataceae bacterium]MCK9289327.1 serine hydroxymethyltransferase [Acholeplasmataceae bacterium]MCK9427790.1 serine hydroxymethyltransferase [Acholeplasmataceae bacterium]HHT39622.1 serine hydroxymethyltransferase [Acholeplasmataceae bacterium]
MDKLIFKAINDEYQRQQNHLELIASENFVSKEVLKAGGSIFTNKYAEGYPGKRYYGGCEFADVVEDLARERAKQLFNAKFANVQAHSGSQANMAAIRSLINHGEKILGMKLDSGGHLTHGYRLSFSGQDYQGVTYSVNKKTEEIDYEEVKKVALKEKPQLIIAGASAYAKIIDFKKFREIADLVGAYLLVDMAHIAGLIAGGMHPSPFPYADVVTSTTHKTLRGPRGGLILTNDEELAKKIDRNVFPGIQGGPLMHIIAAKAVSFYEALKPEFKEYQKQVVLNAKALAKALSDYGFRIVSGGTDNHLVLVDVYDNFKITGKEAEELLGEMNITINKNTIPFDQQKPFITSGMRLGTPAMTTRGFKEEEMKWVAKMIYEALILKQNVKQEIINKLKAYPIYEEVEK